MNAQNSSSCLPRIACLVFCLVGFKTCLMFRPLMIRHLTNMFFKWQNTPPNRCEFLEMSNMIRFATFRGGQIAQTRWKGTTDPPQLVTAVGDAKHSLIPVFTKAANFASAKPRWKLRVMLSRANYS